MKTRKELLKSKGYWITKIQIDLFAQIKIYLEKNKLSKTAFAKQIGVTKGYVTQVLNGDFDHKVSKLVELSLAIDKVPVITYQDVNSYIEDSDKIAIEKSEVIPMNFYMNISKNDIGYNIISSNEIEVQRNLLILNQIHSQINIHN
jgi:transcriptional regulator with XRE-family HTH domain